MRFIISYLSQNSIYFITPPSDLDRMDDAILFISLKLIELIFF